MIRALYPGTFDPITLGHQDLIQRACGLFDQLVVAIADNPKKSPCFSLEQRISLAREVLAGEPKVQVVGFQGLMVDLARQLGARVIIRGLRAVADFEYEFQMAMMNRRLAPELETLFLTPQEPHIFLSSSLVREVASHGGALDSLVAPPVAQALKRQLARNPGA